jgi:general secretion pathway protein J
MSSKQYGFTLIEVMVALLLMAILSVLSWRALDSMSRTREILDAHGKQDDQLKSVFNQWDKDCRSFGLKANWVVSVPVRMDETQLVFLKEKQLANGITRPIVVMYELQGKALVRMESRPLNTRQELTRAWTNALHHHLTTDLGLQNKEVLLDSVSALSTAIFLQGKGWVRSDEAIINAQNSQDTNSVKALSLSITLDRQNVPFQKIALTGVD